MQRKRPSEAFSNVAALAYLARGESGIASSPPNSNLGSSGMPTSTIRQFPNTKWATESTNLKGGSAVNVVYGAQGRNATTDNYEAVTAAAHFNLVDEALVEHSEDLMPDKPKSTL